tara:strand:- start:744 stop:1025 length:282 start_codon:yes stop_codon:yes gene_type:complete
MSSNKLEPCRAALQQAGLSFFVGRGAKAFVRPSQWEMAEKFAISNSLGFMHVIVSSEFVDLLDEVIQKDVRSKSRPKRRSRIAIDLARESLWI